MTEADKLNIDNIIARLLEGKTSLSRKGALSRDDPTWTNSISHDSLDSNWALNSEPRLQNPLLSSLNEAGVGSMETDFPHSHFHLLPSLFIYRLNN
jgi:hypothetical protein